MRAAESEIHELISKAEQVRAVVGLRNGGSSGSVGAALRTVAGNVYTGVCLDLACGLGICAEHAAVADMLKHQETDVVAVVAVGADGIMSPCGKCRELLMQLSLVNANANIVLPEGRSARLGDLLPDHWL